MHEWVVSTKDNLEKFKMEFEDHFDLHYSLIYYVYTFFALMVDQRAKNMFLTYWGETGKWQPWFYDNDTSFGINNEGQLVLDYYHEDTDQLGTANVYNGQNSVLWTNFRQAFPDEIKETYQNLRNNGLITYDKLIDRFITNGSDKWSESIYNEDMDFKYISMLRSDDDATNLPQVRGSGEEHFRYFIENRLNYCDSKWYASDYANDYISLRIYTPTTWSGVEPNPTITVTPFSDMYAGVRYKANGTLYQERATHGVPVSFSPKGETFESENNETFNDTETAVYGAHQLSSIGDLAPLYCGSVNVSNADKLIELKVGDGTAGYSNSNLHELSVGTNKLLQKIDIQNCPNFASVLDLSNCPAIEEVYAKGSSITGVSFPESGKLRIAQLPATITNFTLKHQLYIEELTIAGYDAIKTLWIENCPNVDGFDMLSKATNTDRVRLTDVDLSYDTAAEMLALAARPIGGIDENGTNIDKMWIDGKCHIKTLTGAEYLEIKEAFPYVTITYDALTADLIFMSEDGTTELARQTIQNGGDGSYTGTTPTKSSTAQYTYSFAGWSLTPGGSANANALKNVEADRTVYAAFSSTVRTYTVRFYNGTTLLQTVNNVPYGGTATYTGSTPTNNSTGNTADFQFYGWSPSPANIKGDTSCYAQYHDLREITDDWATIKSKADAGTATYGVGAFKTLEIGLKDLPYEFYRGSAVVYNDEIHILGSGNASSRKKHYKWNGTEWTSVSTLPYYFDDGSAIVYNNEIHILGSGYSSSYHKYHYKWNGTEWVSVSTLPYNFYGSEAVVYNNEIHIFGSIGASYNKRHYKWNGTEWTSVSTLPYEFYYGSAIVYNNEIHILGSGYSSSYYKYHYKWNGTEWVSVSTLPYNFYKGSAVVYNDEIHIFGSVDGSSYYKRHYKWNGTGWTSVSTLPYEFVSGSIVVFNDEIHTLGSSINGGYTAFYYYSTETQTWSKYLTESIPMQLVAKNHDSLPDGVGKWESLGQIPYEFYRGSAVMLNGEIHIMGSGVNTLIYRTYHYKWNGTSWTSVAKLPYDFYQGSAVVYNDEIHILGGGGSSSRTAHYKFNGTEWTSVSTLPYNFYQGSAVVYNNEIHILGSNDSSSRTAHYKFNGTEWTSVSTLPYNFYQGSAVVYNNEIHILGGSGGNGTHYKYDGSAWVKLNNLSYGFTQGSAVVYNDEIHILGSYSDSYRQYHYKYDGTSWTQDQSLSYGFYDGCTVVYNNKITLLGSYVSGYYKSFTYLNTPKTKWENIGIKLPYTFYEGSSVIYNDEIHILGGCDTYTNHYKWNGTEWTSVSTLPYNFYGGSAVVYNDEIHILGSTGSKTSHYKWNGSEWTSVSTLPYDFYVGSAVVYNNEIHILGSQNTSYRKYHYKWNGSTWVSVSTLPYNFYDGSTVVYNNEIHILGSQSSSKYHYEWNGSTWVSVSTLPYEFYTGSAVVYNDEIHILGGSGGYTMYYKLNGTKWTSSSTLPYTFYRGSAIVYNNEICILGGGNSGTYYRSFYRLNTTNPKANLTFIAKNLLKDSRKMDSSTSQTGGWAETDLRAWLNNDFLAMLPSDLQTAITEVKKISDGGYGNKVLTSTNDKIWLLSASEVDGVNTQYMLDDQGETYPIFTDMNSRKKYKVGSTTASSWWLRTSSYYNTVKAYYACVFSAGQVGISDDPPTLNYILIGFCI